MAPKIKKCQYCLTEVLSLKKGWQLRIGSFAKLCFTCSSAYKDGTFCATYHARENGWRKCDECNRDFHCGCIMSFHLFENNDTCGITCVQCLANADGASNTGASTSAPIMKDYSSSSSVPGHVTVLLTLKLLTSENLSKVHTNKVQGGMMRTSVELLASLSIGNARTPDDPAVSDAADRETKDAGSISSDSVELVTKGVDALELGKES